VISRARSPRDTGIRPLPNGTTPLPAAMRRKANRQFSAARAARDCRRSVAKSSSALHNENFTIFIFDHWKFIFYSLY